MWTSKPGGGWGGWWDLLWNDHGPPEIGTCGSSQDARNVFKNSFLQCSALDEGVRVAEYEL